MDGLRRVKAKRVPANPKAAFLPYQVRWCEDRSRIKLVEKSRQVGFSWATSNDLVSQAISSEAKYDFWVSSRDEMQARLFLQDCKTFADGYKKAIEAVANQNIYTDIAGKPYTSFDLKFYNGIAIHSMSSNADAQAGKRGTRVLDEFALHPDPVKLYAIAYPGITWGGQMAIISTHRGADNFFNKLVLEAKFGGNPKKISLHRVTLEDALNDGFLFKLQQNLSANDPRQDMDEAEYFDDVKSKCADSESFLQEYMCVPCDDASMFISPDISEGCFYRFDEVWETDIENCAGDLYIGVDVGRDSDLTVIWVFEKLGGMLFTRRVETLKNMTFAAQESVLYPYLALPKMRRCCIDQTGLGRQFAERAAEKFGKYRVEGIQFTAPSKERMAFPLRAKFEDKTIRIPDTAAIRADLRGVKKTVGTSGLIRFDSARNENGHCDRFWAMALGVEAAGAQTQSYLQSVQLERNRRFIW